jgi:hypothetical protein
MTEPQLRLRGTLRDLPRHRLPELRERIATFLQSHASLVGAVLSNGRSMIRYITLVDEALKRVIPNTPAWNALFLSPEQQYDNSRLHLRKAETRYIYVYGIERRDCCCVHAMHDADTGEFMGFSMLSSPDASKLAWILPSLTNIHDALAYLRANAFPIPIETMCTASILPVVVVNPAEIEFKERDVLRMPVYDALIQRVVRYMQGGPTRALRPVSSSYQSRLDERMHRLRDNTQSLRRVITVMPSGRHFIPSIETDDLRFGFSRGRNITDVSSLSSDEETPLLVQMLDEPHTTQLASLPIPGLCSVCATPTHGLRHCGACKQGCYCSRECQAADWPRHKRLFHYSSASVRPAPEARA